MNYTITHIHSDRSNPTTIIDSVTNFTHYVDRAKELEMKAIAFTEHGNAFSWVKKKEYIEKQGMKFIFGIEMYMTKSLEEKIRDNYHVCLYAKNWSGVQELLKLITKTYNREDGHYYYTPRMTFEEFKNLSDNILFSTACLGGVIASNDEELKQEFINHMLKNKDRCWLEVQHHQDKDQINYNKYLLNLSKQTGLKLIAGTDTHALDERHAKGRIILQKSKDVHFDNEDSWDITMKTCDELVELYRKQRIFTDEEIFEFLDNTNKLADMVEEFELDRSHKYPKMSDNPVETLKEKVIEGIKEKEIYKYPNYDEYKKRINEELKVYEHNNAIDYLLLDAGIKEEARKNGIYFGYGRGSVNGSLIAYLMGITEMDSIKHNLNFQRFMHSERVSMCDIDSDMSSKDREWIKKYLFNKHGLYCSEIITFNTVALKGAIRDCGRALNIPLETINQITKDIDDESNEIMYRQLYPELFEYVDIVNGTIVSIGTHPAGVIVSPIPLDENIGLVTLPTTQYPVSMVNMKEIDGLSYVKLDLLILENAQLINETCKLAGIDRLTPDNVPDDEKVWKSIRNDTTCIFQYESDSAARYLKELFSDETVKKIKERNPNFKYIDLFAVGNGAIRPAGASYREELAQGIFRDNGHEALNEMLAPTLGYLVYQCQIIEFLNKFCGYTMGEADMVRRSFSKLKNTSEHLPRIKKGFIETMETKYGVHKEEAEELIINFLKVIEDASDYLFSVNHSQPYSYIGYVCGYLRYYYPLEFFTTALNINSDNLEKTTKIIECVKEHNITIEPPTYGKSKAKYFFDKETDTIYKGVGSVKYLNDELADKLYQISQETNYLNFEDLYLSSQGINSRQWEVLIKIGYFRNFGSAKYLLQVIDVLNEYINKKQFKKDKVDCDLIRRFAKSETDKMFKDVDTLALCLYIISTLKKDEFTIGELARFEAEYIGSVNITNPNVDNRECIVLDVNTKYTPTLTLYRLRNGEIIKVKVAKDFFNDKRVEKFNHIHVSHCTKRQKNKKVDGKWVKTDEFDFYINYYILG